MLDEAMFNVEDWLAEQLGREFAVAEGSAFVNGNGTSRPKGFLTYATTNEADSARAFGTLQHLATGTAGAFPASNPQDKLVELVHSLKAPYQQGACWAMNSDTLARIRKFKTTEIGRASCRERVWSVRVDLGGRRIIKKKNKEYKDQT